MQGLITNVKAIFDDKMEDLWTSFVTNQQFEYKACKLPCREITVNVKKGAAFQTDQYDFIELRMAPQVHILQERPSYGVFDLVVEVGSALGLWIGLSILGVFDVAFHYTSKWKTAMKLK